MTLQCLGQKAQDSPLCTVGMLRESACEPECFSMQEEMIEMQAFIYLSVLSVVGLTLWTVLKDNREGFAKYTHPLGGWCRETSDYQHIHSMSSHWHRQLFS